MGYVYFTEEQKERANTVDLKDFLERQGERLLRSGPVLLVQDGCSGMAQAVSRLGICGGCMCKADMYEKRYQNYLSQKDPSSTRSFFAAFPTLVILVVFYALMGSLPFPYLSCEHIQGTAEREERRKAHGERRQKKAPTAQAGAMWEMYAVQKT